MKTWVYVILIWTVVSFLYFAVVNEKGLIPKLSESRWQLLHYVMSMPVVIFAGIVTMIVGIKK